MLKQLDESVIKYPLPMKTFPKNVGAKGGEMVALKFSNKINQSPSIVLPLKV